MSDICKYRGYAEKRAQGGFGEMNSWFLVLPYLKNKRVLDVGCSDGLYLRQFDGASVGIEQVPELAERARGNGLNVITADINDALRWQGDGGFDAVLFSHVMEHVDCPIRCLRHINRALKSNGTLILGLPTERNLYRDFLRMDYFNGTHIYAFTVRNAQKLLSETDFVVVRIFFHLPKLRGRVGERIHKFWNDAAWPFREYLSMAYWIVARKRA